MSKDSLSVDIPSPYDSGSFGDYLHSIRLRIINEKFKSVRFNLNQIKIIRTEEIKVFCLHLQTLDYMGLNIEIKGIQPSLAYTLVSPGFERASKIIDRFAT